MTDPTPDGPPADDATPVDAAAPAETPAAPATPDSPAAPETPTVPETLTAPNALEAEPPAAEEPQRTRFVDPPPSDVPPALPEPPPAAPVPVEAPVASAPVDVPPAPVEQTRAPEPVEEGPVAQVALPPAPVEQTRTPEPVADVPVAHVPLPSEPVEDVPVADAAPEQPVRPEGSSSRWLTVAAVVLVAAIGGVAFWLVTVLNQGGSRFASDGDPALRAAKAAVPTLLGYDYRTLDAGLAAGQKLTVDLDGKDCPKKVDPKDPLHDAKANCFRSEFIRTHDLVVKDFATRYKVVATADVSAGGVERVDGDQVTVLLYVNQQSTRSDRSDPLVTQARVEMLLQHKGGRWLVADITAL